MKLISEYFGPLRTSKVFYDEDTKTYVTVCLQDQEVIIKDISFNLDPAEDLADDWVR